MFSSIFLDRLKVVDVNYKSYFRTKVDDQGGEGTSKKKKKNEADLGAPNYEDWENARYAFYIA